MNDPGERTFREIKAFKHLPSLPHILLRLIEVCNREESSVRDIAEIIKRDVSLSEKVMRVVNSTLYGLPNKVTSIDTALTLLGKDSIRNISISASVHEAFKKAKGNSVFDLKIFWKHSLMCAILARLIAESVSYASPDEAFLSGLLHDIGKLILWTNFPRQYADILSKFREQPDLMLAQEAQQGATHCEVGAWLIEKQWALQSFMADSIRYHHESADRIHNSLPLVKILYAANLLCPETDKEKVVKLGMIETLFDLSAAETEQMVAQADEEVREIATSLGIDIGPSGETGNAPLAEEQATQEELIREVKDIALLHGTLQNLMKAQNEDSILKAIHHGLSVLFDIKKAIVFLHDPERAILSCRNAEYLWPNDSGIVLDIPFRKDHSVIGNALLQDNPICSLDDSTGVDLTIADEQIVRLMGCDGIWCFPMIAHKQYTGVLVVGIDKALTSRISEQMGLLTIFISQANLALHADGMRRNQAGRILSERLEALSVMARKVVHEVNTPLNIMKNYLAVLHRDLSEKNIDRDKIRLIDEEIDRITQLMLQLTDFSEPEIQSTDLVDINTLLSDIAALFRASLPSGKRVAIELELDSTLPSVHSDRNRLKQIFTNLIKNAMEAISEEGNVYIRTRLVSSSLAMEEDRDREYSPGDVEIIIKDDGPGVPEALRRRLFEPFVTSKGAGHSGLGLSIVHSTIKELKGTITCDSDSESGTKFKVVFPLVP